MNIRFSESELKSLRERVTEAESGTPGEVVVFVVPRSNSYESILWRGGVAGLLASVVIWAVLPVTWPAWGAAWLLSPGFCTALLAPGTIVGLSLARWNGAAFRLLAGKTLLQRTVRRRAQRAFLEEGVVETKGRTGILLLVSVLERRIEVVADRGITSAVPEDRWQGVVDCVRTGLKNHDLMGALSAGVSACGEILRDSGITAEGNDRNELTDDIRFETD